MPKNNGISGSWDNFMADTLSLANIPACVAVFDNNLQFMDLSTCLAKSLGFENILEVIGKGLSEFVAEGEKTTSLLAEGLNFANGIFEARLSLKGRDEAAHYFAKFTHDRFDSSTNRIYASFELASKVTNGCSLSRELADDLKNSNNFDSSRPMLHIMEATNSTIWEYDFTRNSIDLQNSFMKFLRVTSESDNDLFESMFILVHPNDESILTEAINRLKNSDAAQNFTARFRDSDGGWRWLNISGCVTHRFSNGAPRSARGLVIDITRTVNLESSIKETESTLNVVSVLSGTCHFEIDLYSGKLEWSKAAKRIFETESFYEPVCVDNFLATFFDAEAANCLRQAIDNVLFSQMEFTIELPVTSTKGHKKWLEFFGAPKFEGKEVVGLVGAFHDIRDKIETSVVLAEALQKARSASESKSLFLANMSHEIRTPLNGVLGIAAALKRAGLNADQNAMVDIILTSGKNLSELLNDILDFSKMESGQVSMELIESPAYEIFDNVFALFEQSAFAKGLEFVLDNQIPRNKFITADPTRLKQILSNLVGNAIKFTSHGKVQISARLEPICNQTAKLIFEVSDTGKGFDEIDKAFLFDRFTQAEASINRKFGGTGLGLSICKSLAHLMNGTLDAHSKPGEGAVFWFEGVFEFKTESSRQELEISSPDLTGKARILAAEDNKINQTVLELLLREFDFELIFANDGFEAVEAFKKHNFDIVLMDTQMPKMDGLEATTKIREFERITGLDRTPIITLSANVMKEQIESALAAGADDYIAKPIDAKDMFSKIAKWLALRNEVVETSPQFSKIA